MVRTALITGASSGIGKAIATQMVDLGYQVIGTSRHAPAEGPIAATGLTMVQLDVCDDASVGALQKRLEEAEASPDMIVLNAGFGIAGPIEETATETAIGQFDTNFFGVHRVVRSFLPAMRASGQGQVIVIGSMLGRVSLPFQAFYAASKSALASYTAGLRLELKAFGIHVSLIEPGDHQSDFIQGRNNVVARPDSAYEPHASRAVAIMEENERNGAPAARVAERVCEAAQSADPKATYLQIKPSERQLLWLQKLLSNRAFERFVLKALKIPEAAD